MDWEPWVHFLHVASAIVWVGDRIMLTIVGIRARGSSDAERLADFGQLLPYAGLRVLTPAVILVLLPALQLPDVAHAQRSGAASMRSKEIAA